MKRIAILRCLRSHNNCTGASCLQAFNRKKAYFSRYEGEELELAAFWSCNGCLELDMKDSAGMQEKLERLLTLDLAAVHIGVCCRTRVPDSDQTIWCETVRELAAYLEQQGITVVWGTHG